MNEKFEISGLTFVFFCISVGLVTQLKTSTKSPQFFRENTNIQKLLDLKSKYSSLGPVQCNDCSAIYSLKKVRSSWVYKQKYVIVIISVQEEKRME